MPRLPRWTAIEAERALLAASFEFLRSKGSHRIYGKGPLRVTVPFHTGAVLHPKIVKQVLETIEDAGQIAPQDD
jgi:predicted RNA binding protein YcfA (HicA-like mRNA interferase family)